jgi:hypothetical protein
MFVAPVHGNSHKVATQKMQRMQDMILPFE